MTQGQVDSRFSEQERTDDKLWNENAGEMTAAPHRPGGSDECIVGRVNTPTALAGWRWEETMHGIALTMQLAQTAEDFERKNFRKAVIVMNDRQLRSLARDLSRATSQRGLPLFARKSLSRRLFRRITAIFR